MTPTAEMANAGCDNETEAPSALYHQFTIIWRGKAWIPSEVVEQV